jgi:hypothetical protein
MSATHTPAACPIPVRLTGQTAAIRGPTAQWTSRRSRLSKDWRA